MHGKQKSTIPNTASPSSASYPSAEISLDDDMILGWCETSRIFAVSIPEICDDVNCCIAFQSRFESTFTLFEMKVLLDDRFR